MTLSSKKRKYFRRQTWIIDDAPDDVIEEMKRMVAETIAVDASELGYYLCTDVEHKIVRMEVRPTEFDEPIEVEIMVSGCYGKPIIDEWERILSNG